MDGCFLLVKSMLKDGDLHAPHRIHDTQACDSAITWTAGECFAVISAMRGPSIRMLGHLSWMRSERAIERLWSGFHEPETSLAHVEMLWHRHFHESTVDRAVLLAFKLQ